MRTKATGLAVALAISAGAHVAAADPPPANRCVLRQVGDLKVRFERNRALLDGAINGAPVQVLIDTGASASLLFRAKARALGLPLADVQGARMGGAGGMTQVQSAFLHQLQIAGAAMSNFSILVAGEGTGADFDVLLGEDFLRAYDIEFDLAHQAVRLLQPRNCGEGDMAYWTQSYNETPITETRGGKIEITVKLNGRPVRAILDSGAQTSVAVPTVAARAGVKLEASDIKGRGLGARTLSNQIGALDFAIGGEEIRNTRMRFSDLFGATTFTETGSILARPMADQPEMLLGADFLKSHRVLVSRTHRMMYFTYEGGPVFDTTRRSVPPPSPAAFPGLPEPAASTPGVPGPGVPGSGAPPTQPR